ncbi:MAG: hypothetical protein ACTSVE_03945 [Candidatus Helarchaeota archaeon]
MGKDKSKKKPEYWLKWKNVAKEMKKIIKRNNKKFPTLQELRRLDFENQEVEKAIMRHGMTLDEVRLKMGYKSEESSSRDKMLALLEASTDSFLSNIREIKKERAEFMGQRIKRTPAQQAHAEQTGVPQAPVEQTMPENPVLEIVSTPPSYSQEPSEEAETNPEDIQNKLKAFEKKLKKFEV